ncbi:MAG: GNAT family N-acetyltransferase [Solirubrobacteraceae bacterium]
MTTALRLALAADRAVRRRAAVATIPFPDGLAVRHPELYDVHYLNAVLIDADTAPLDAGAVEAVSDRWLGDLRHRHVVFDDAEAGERAAAQLESEGWERARVAFMVFAGDPTRVAGDRRGRPVSEAEMEALQLANVRDRAPEIGAGSGLAARLASTQRRLRTTTSARCFGAGDPGHELASMCTLFLDPDVNGRRVAMVTDVVTRVAHRERGLARAVVSAAIADAGRWGAELIVVGADAYDWPQLMYAALGFESVGLQVALTRRIPQRSGSVSGGV